MQAVCARVILLKKYQLARFWVQSDAVAPGSRLYLAINHSQEATLFAATMSGSPAGPEGSSFWLVSQFLCRNYTHAQVHGLGRVRERSYGNVIHTGLRIITNIL
jgi:hypothetical protein